VITIVDANLVSSRRILENVLNVLLMDVLYVNQLIDAPSVTPIGMTDLTIGSLCSCNQIDHHASPEYTTVISNQPITLSEKANSSAIDVKMTRFGRTLLELVLNAVKSSIAVMNVRD